MRTFKVSKVTRSIVLEAGIGVAATLGIAALCGVPALGVSVIDPHPVWLVVIVLAARYATRGLAISIPIAWGALAVANGAHGPGRVLDTLAMPIELGALAASVLVGWVASSNERRERALANKTAELERRVSGDAAMIRDLRRAALALRTRNDRLDLSLTFLRSIAQRLHGTDAEGAAQAALELIGARIGARAASIDLHAGGELRSLAVIGIWNREAPDRTSLAALESRQPMRALELADGGPGDSDIAAPIVDAAGVARGVVAARGVPGGGSSMAALRDLAVIADWVSRAICQETTPGRGEAAEGERAAGAEPGSSDPGERETGPLTVSRANA